MTSLRARRIAFEELRLLPNGFIGVGYTIVPNGVFAPAGLDLFAHPVRLIKVNNSTNINIIISYDGVHDHDYVQAGGAYVYDYGTNRAEPAESLEQPESQGIWVKQASAAIATVGEIAVTVIYATAS